MYITDFHQGIKIKLNLNVDNHNILHLYVVRNSFVHSLICSFILKLRQLVSQFVTHVCNSAIVTIDQSGLNVIAN